MLDCGWLRLCAEVHLLDLASTHCCHQTSLTGHVRQLQLLLGLPFNFEQRLRLLFWTCECENSLRLLNVRTNSHLTLGDDFLRTEGRSQIVWNIQLNLVGNTYWSVLNLKLPNSTWHHTATFETPFAANRDVSRIFRTHNSESRLLATVAHLADRWFFAVSKSCSFRVFRIKWVDKSIFCLLDYLAVRDLVFWKGYVLLWRVLCRNRLLYLQEKARRLLQMVADWVVTILCFYSYVVETLFTLGVV